MSAFFTRRILGAVAFALVFGAACIALGRWQLSRYEAKDVRASAVETNYARPAVPLATVLPNVSTELAESAIWTRVSTSGRYLDQQFFVRGRVLDGVPGYEILVPLRVEGAGVLLVDRGWVANADTAAELPSVPPAPSGPVTVSGWLKPGESVRTQGLPAGQLGSVDLDAAQGQVRGALYAAYLVLEAEQVADGSTPTRPQALRPPEPDRGPHFAYALQWFLTALMGLAFVVYLYRTRPGAPQPDTTAVATGKPKKVRIWDEEDG